jgi:DICT domain-containing protein
MAGLVEEPLLERSAPDKYLRQLYIMSLSPAQFSGETSGAVARASDPASPQSQEVQLVASGDKVSGGRRRRRSSKARKSARKTGRKAGRRSRRRSVKKSWFMM